MNRTLIERMSAYSLIAFSTFFTAFFLGIYMLLIDARKRTHHLFFLGSLVVALWNLLAAFFFSAQSKESFLLLFRLASTLGILFYSMMPHLTVVSIKKPRSGWIVFLSYALSAVAHYRNWTSYYLFQDFTKVDGVWAALPALNSFWQFYWLVYSRGAIALCVILVYRWMKTRTSPLERKHGVIISLSFSVFLALSFLEIPALAPFAAIPPIGSMFVVIVVFGVWFAVFKYRFLSITDTMVSKSILENMDVFIILLDPTLRVMMINRKAEAMLGKNPNKVVGKDVTLTLCLTPTLRDGIQRVLGEQVPSFSCNYTIDCEGQDSGESPMMELKLSLARDRMGEKLGILIIGQEVLGLTHFCARFHITLREWEAVHFICSGATNKEIAERLHITERTVKAHVTHIYDKLGVNNKMGLLKVLREFNLMPEAGLALEPKRDRIRRSRPLSV